MPYNKEHFIRKFSEIPEHHWTTGTTYDPHSGGRCAIGHCGEDTMKEKGVGYGEEATALIELLANHYFPTYCNNTPKVSDDRKHWAVVNINDASIENRGRFNQPTPKQRILAALAGLPDAS